MLANHGRLHYFGLSNTAIHEKEPNISVLKIKYLQKYLEPASLCGPLNWHDFHIHHPWETFRIHEPLGLQRTNKTRKADVEIVV